MESLKGFKPGDKVEVVVKRDGKEVKLQAELGGSTLAAQLTQRERPGRHPRRPDDLHDRHASS